MCPIEKWETLWTSLQCLEFRDLGSRICFRQFVELAFILRKPLHITILRLELPSYFDQDHLNMWIIYVVNHNVKVLDLEFIWFVNEYELPQRLFTCSSLEELRVASCDGIINFPVKTSWNRLKKLQLYYLKFSDVCLKNMIAGCSMIETLNLGLCLISHSSESEVVICSTSLKYLTIEHSLMDTARFCTPNIVRLYHESMDGACFIDMPNIDDVTISYGVGETPVEVSIALIKPVAMTKSLNLWGAWTERISKEELSKFPTFVILERLTIAKNCVHDFLSIGFFLQHAPNLECLTLVLPVQDDRHCCCDLRESYDPENAPKYPDLPFNCPRLKLIEIQCSNRRDASDLLITFVKNWVLKTRIPIRVL